MNTFVNAQSGCYTIKCCLVNGSDIIKGHSHFQRIALHDRVPTGAIEQYGQAGPGFGQARLGALWNIHHSQSTFAALLIRLQNHPMAVPKVTVIARIAIAVFIIKRGIVKTPDAQDKRVTHMAVTEAGRALLDRLLPSPLLTAGLAELSEDKAQNLEGSLKNLLRGLQRQNRFKSFGQCATCIHNADAGAGQYLCKLTGEALTQSETQLICREHEYPSA